MKEETDRESESDVAKIIFVKHNESPVEADKTSELLRGKRSVFH